MDIKVHDANNKIIVETVNKGANINIDAVLRVDLTINDEYDTVLEYVDALISEIKDDLKIVKNKVIKGSKRNTLIPLESFNAIKPIVNQKLEKRESFDAINDWINLVYMARFVNEKDAVIYDCFDYWYTLNDLKVPKMESALRRLGQYKQLSEIKQKRFNKKGKEI